MTQSLSLLTGKACLRLTITVIILEDKGNVKDMSLLACMAALKDTQLPQVGKDLIEVDGKFWLKEATEPITSLVKVNEGTEKKNASNTHHRDYRISLTSGVWVPPSEKTAYLLTDP